MPDTADFEKAWLGKLSAALDRLAGEELRREVLRGSADHSSSTDSDETIRWSAEAMDRIDDLLDPATAREVMVSCACHYPVEALRDVRSRYEETGSVDEALDMLRDKFTAFLRDGLGACEDTIGELLSRGWGLAGVRSGNTIIATKIPKSGNLIEYMSEPDPERRRHLYCHCPRVREAVAACVSISPTYCYCGAGFYSGIWEEILQQPVEVEVLRSIFMGDDVCSFLMRLPAEADSAAGS